MIFKKLFGCFNRDMDIDTGLGFIIMAKHLFDVIDGYTGFEHLSGKCMPPPRGLAQRSFRTFGGMLIVGESVKYRLILCAAQSLMKSSHILP